MKGLPSKSHLHHLQCKWEKKPKVGERREKIWITCEKIGVNACEKVSPITHLENYQLTRRMTRKIL